MLATTAKDLEPADILDSISGDLAYAAALSAILPAATEAADHLTKLLIEFRNAFIAALR